MAVPRRSGNASGAGRYSGQAIATTPGSAYRCITKGGDQGPAVSGQHDRPGVQRYDHIRDVIRRAAMPATDRKSVVSGKSVTGSVDLGGWRFFKKKKKPASTQQLT